MLSLRELYQSTTIMTGPEQERIGAATCLLELANRFDPRQSATRSSIESEIPSTIQVSVCNNNHHTRDHPPSSSHPISSCSSSPISHTSSVPSLTSSLQQELMSKSLQKMTSIPTVVRSAPLYPHIPTAAGGVINASPTLTMSTVTSPISPPSTVNFAGSRRGSPFTRPPSAKSPVSIFGTNSVLPPVPIIHANQLTPHSDSIAFHRLNPYSKASPQASSSSSTVLPFPVTTPINLNSTLVTSPGPSPSAKFRQLLTDPMPPPVFNGSVAATSNSMSASFAGPSVSGTRPRSSLAKEGIVKARRSRKSGSSKGSAPIDAGAAHETAPTSPAASSATAASGAETSRASKRKSSDSSEDGSQPSKKKAYIPSYVQDGEKCVVCGDHSTGTHYRAMTCEGCKGFFRRTVQNKGYIRFECKKDKKCKIQAQTRNSCQYCRYQLCLANKMDPDSVLSAPERQNLRSLIENNRAERQKKLSQLLSKEEADMLLQLGEAFRSDSVRNFYKFSVVTDPAVPSNQMHPGVEHAMKFVNAIPFLDQLSEKDQLTLLFNHLLDILGLRMAELFDEEENAIKFPNKTFKEGDLDHYPFMARTWEFLKFFSKYVTNDGVVLAALAVIRFYCPDGVVLENSSKVEELQDQMQGVLLKYLQQERICKIQNLYAGLVNFESIRLNDSHMFAKMCMLDCYEKGENGACPFYPGTALENGSCPFSKLYRLMKSDFISPSPVSCQLTMDQSQSSSCSPLSLNHQSSSSPLNFINGPCSPLNFNHHPWSNGKSVSKVSASPPLSTCSLSTHEFWVGGSRALLSNPSTLQNGTTVTLSKPRCSPMIDVSPTPKIVTPPGYGIVKIEPEKNGILETFINGYKKIDQPSVRLHNGVTQDSRPYPFLNGFPVVDQHLPDIKFVSHTQLSQTGDMTLADYRLGITKNSSQMDTRNEHASLLNKLLLRSSFLEGRIQDLRRRHGDNTQLEILQQEQLLQRRDVEALLRFQKEHGLDISGPPQAEAPRLIDNGVAGVLRLDTRGSCPSPSFATTANNGRQNHSMIPFLPRASHHEYRPQSASTTIETSQWGHYRQGATSTDLIDSVEEEKPQDLSLSSFRREIQTAPRDLSIKRDMSPQEEAPIISHQFSSATMSYHQLPSATMSYHQLPSATMGSHQLPSATMGSHQLPSATMGSHQLLSAPSSSHQQPAATSSSHQQPAAPSSSHQQPTAPSSSHQQPSAPSSSHQQPEAPSSSHQLPEAPSSSHQLPEAPSSSQQQNDHEIVSPPISSVSSDDEDTRRGSFSSSASSPNDKHRSIKKRWLRRLAAEAESDRQ